MSKVTAVPVTQRAYTLRLRGIPPQDNTCPQDQTWRENLWRTHEAVNNGAKAFGDWLLTLRGGLCHTLADMPTVQGKGKPDQSSELRDRRILLALSWLSVESKDGAPSNVPGLIVASGNEPHSDRNHKVMDAFRKILQSRGFNKNDSETWVQACASSLSATIRDDAVWVNRSDAFDKHCKTMTGLTRQYAAQTILNFFGPEAEYFSLPTTEAIGAGARDGPEFSTLSRGWISTNFGTGKKSDSGQVIKSLRTIAGLDLQGFDGRPKVDLLSHLVRILGGNPAGVSQGSLPDAIGWKGRPSKGRLAIDNLPDTLTLSVIETLQAKCSEEAKEKQGKVGQSTAPAWIASLQQHIEAQAGMPFVRNRNHTGEFAVMLDHAARRVSLAHTWIKRAEAERRQFEEDARKIADVPETTKEWLDSFCLRRSDVSGASDTYRIRRRAVDGWKDVVQAWMRCKSEADRLTAVGAVQAESQANDEKFGDGQLFEALAAEDARCVWEGDGHADHQILLDYVSAAEAEAKKRRFKVPAYRHPDPLLHPIFCDFGYSRWEISFAAHEAARHLIEAQLAVAAATTPQQKKRAAKKLNAAEQQAQAVNSAGYDRTLSMGLWTGLDIVDTPLLWQGKRMGRDLALSRSAAETNSSSTEVTRADRLGRAAGGAAEDVSVNIIGLFEQEKWNGRLQAPRAQLEVIARVRDDQVMPAAERRKRLAKMLSRLRWLMTFSAKLQPQGPWMNFAEANGLRPNPEYWPHAEENRKRQGLARLGLCRLPGLRVISVDLGHRYAAACAVWETLSGKQMKAACRAAGVASPSDADLYVHLKSKNQEGGLQTTIYRRIGSDELEQIDAETGEVGNIPHPAPWARLDRQFLIKLQGEEGPARQASDVERRAVGAFEQAVGRQPFERRSLRVDELMSETVRAARLALVRHGRRARIAFNLTAVKRLLPGGREEPLDDKGRVAILTEALADWHGLFTGKGWNDNKAERTWAEYIAPLTGDQVLPQVPEDGAAAATRRKYRDEVAAALQPVAEKLARNLALRQKLQRLWAERWSEDNAIWHKHLRWLRDWVLPRGRRAMHAGIRHVGGLSLTRIATIKSLYQVQKAFHMRPEPENLRKNIPARGDDDLRDFGRGILNTMERMREQRVKQLASRIVEAALGIGRMKRSKSGKDQRRPRARVDEPCHAVVIENLTHYRPEETRTRRENRQLMSWSSGKVKKYLAEACQLHGLHLREVPASYTSRQDSRTGAPGIRCQDIPVADFVRQGGYLWKRLKKAMDEVAAKESQASAENRFLAARYADWDEKTKTWTDAGGRTWTWAEEQRRWSAAHGQKSAVDGRSAPAPIRVPQKGGELFVSSDGASPAVKGLQADLNAAANIGLRVLIDPDWPGRWWYVPCDPKDHRPAGDKVKGCRAFDQAAPLPTEVTQAGSADVGRGRKKSKDAPKQVINLWRDVADHSSSWRNYQAYWNAVTAQVIKNLRALADKYRGCGHQ